MSTTTNGSGPSQSSGAFGGSDGISAQGGVAAVEGTTADAQTGATADGVSDDRFGFAAVARRARLEFVSAMIQFQDFNSEVQSFIRRQKSAGIVPQAENESRVKKLEDFKVRFALIEFAMFTLRAAETIAIRSAACNVTAHSVEALSLFAAQLNDSINNAVEMMKSERSPQGKGPLN